MTPYNKQKLGLTVKQIVAGCGILLGAKLLAQNSYDIGCAETARNLTIAEENESESEDEEDL